MLLFSARQRAHLLVAFVTSLLLIGCGSNQRHLHQTSDQSLPANIGLQGYSPVSYFEGQAEQGLPAFQADYDGRVFYFTSAEQVDTFRQNPERYMPRYGDYCPYSLALGRRVAIDPTNFKVVDDQLLLFHDSVELDTVDVKSQHEIFEEADRQYKLLRF